jgi:hypothetical protein
LEDEAKIPLAQNFFYGKSLQKSYYHQRLSLEKLFLKEVFMNIACSCKKTNWTKREKMGEKREIIFGFLV